MKIIFAFCLALAGIPLLASAVLIGALLAARQIYAEEYSPLDFSSDYDKFEVVVGFDNVNGNYATYHYEFKD